MSRKMLWAGKKWERCYYILWRIGWQMGKISCLGGAWSRMRLFEDGMNWGLSHLQRAKQSTIESFLKLPFSI